MQKIRKENRKGERDLPGPLTWPISSWRPAHLPAAFCRPPPRTEGRGRVPDARRHVRAPPPPCWPPPASPGLPRCPGRSHAAAPHRSHSPCPPLLPLLSLPLTREPPPPPTGITVATGLPSPPRHTRKLRSSALKLPVKPCPSGHPVEPSPSPNSTPAAVDPRRRFGSYRASPTSPSRSLVPR